MRGRRELDDGRLNNNSQAVSLINQNPNHTAKQTKRKLCKLSQKH